MHFLKLSTEEKTKNLELAKAVLQAETNKQLKDYRIPETGRKPGSIWQLLDGIKESGLQNDAFLDLLYEMIGERVAPGKESYCFLFHGMYDVPVKGTDKEWQEGSEEVFSNAQTGNIVLMSTHLMMGEWLDVLRYLLPLLAFASGVFFAEKIHVIFKYAKKLHWRQGVLLMEIVILFFVGFMPKHLDLLATVLVSFACAMQVQTFRKVSGYSYASTMCIGNLRSGTEAFTGYLQTHDTEKLKKALYYFGIILFFGLGAGIGGNLSIRFGYHMIWVSSGLLLISFLLMFVEKMDR